MGRQARRGPDRASEEGSKIRSTSATTNHQFLGWRVGWLGPGLRRGLRCADLVSGPAAVSDDAQPMLYREWDMDGDVVTEYERHGECLRCGECCRHRIALQYSKHDGKYHPGIHGVWNEVSSDGYYFCVRLTSVDPERTIADGHPCCALSEDNLCAARDQPDRQELCRQWPFAPRCLEHFPDCGYSFTKIREDVISVAYPSTWAILLDWWEKEKAEEAEKVVA